jgi:hypothetical protein
MKKHKKLLTDEQWQLADSQRTGAVHASGASVAILLSRLIGPVNLKDVLGNVQPTIAICMGLSSP